jgi:hypothetical protein
LGVGWRNLLAYQPAGPQLDKLEELSTVDRRRVSAGVSLLAATTAIVLASPPAAGALTTVASHPRIAAKLPGVQSANAGWASSNWSGYALTGGPYTSITGSWKVTKVAASSRQTFSSTWIGIDGFNDSNLIQTGTEADYYNGAAHYNAWWEILPAAETPISTISVQPGDAMTANIFQITTGANAGKWSITISDVTRNQSFTTTQSYKGQLTSAEWIEEAPSIGSRVATLAHYGGPLTIDPGTVNGQNPGLVPADGGVMVQRAGQVSTPSTPDADADGFNMGYGSTAPAPPAS